MNPEVEKAFKARLDYGLPPLTLAECRFLFESAVNEPVQWPEKRCKACGGSGEATVVARESRDCKHCNGTGFETEDKRAS